MRFARAAIVAACALSGTLVSPAGTIAQPSQEVEAYAIGPRDLLEIRVFEEPTLNVDRRVERDGTIDLPLLGKLVVEGLDEAEVAAALTRRLEESYLQRATVSVEVREFRSRPISVVGAVRTPGQLELTGRTTLLEAITEAGGLADGHTGRIEISRRSANGLADEIEISTARLIDEADPAVNLPLLANDLVRVPVARAITILLMGEVGQRGAVNATEGVTLVEVIARAGGLTDRASNKLIVKRRGADGRLEEMRVNYKEILSGRTPDLELLDGDLIVVKESFL